MMIDAHQHFWRLVDREGHWPPADLRMIYRDFEPKDLKPILDGNGIDGTVLVQTLPNQADTEFMLDLADQHPFILGVVGWVDLKDVDAPAQIARLARHSKLKGLRPMLQSLPDDDWIDDPALQPAIAAMRQHQLTFDALVLPRHLPGLTRFARRFPELPIVIDHAAKPFIAAQVLEPWRTQMNDLAALPNVHCKLSGLLTEAGSNTDVTSLAPYMQAVLSAFSPQRLMWGSDWPVLRLAGDYAAWLAQCLDFCKALFPEDREAIFGGNAARFYRLKPINQEH